MRFLIPQLIEAIMFASPLNVQIDAAKQLNVSIDPYVPWTIMTEVGPDVRESTIDWQKYPISDKNIMVAQRLLLDWWGGKAERREVITDHEFRHANTLLQILACHEDLNKDRLFSDLSEHEIVCIFVKLIFSEWQDDHDGLKVLSSLIQPQSNTKFTRILIVLRHWFSSYASGAISDGPEFLIKQNIVKPVLMEELKSIGMNFGTWQRGGSYGAVPFVIAHLLLSDALDTLRSYKTKQLLVYFETVRLTNAYEHVKAFWVNTAATHLYKYRQTGNSIFLEPTLESKKSGGSANRVKEIFANPLHLRLIELHLEESDGESFIFPWGNTYRFIEDYNRLLGALLIIFLSVMGKRGPSEVCTLRAIDVTRPNTKKGIESTVRSSIEKTHKGLRLEQGITNLIDEAFSVALKLGYLDKTDSELPLFSMLPTFNKPSTDPKRISSQNLWDILNKYYDEFCVRCSEKIDFDIKEKHESISSHQFRHSFAEFGLRKFDGNVQELIRQSFGHSYGHWFIRRYTDDKLDEDRINAINKDYSRELVKNILDDDAELPDFVGGMAVFIKKKVGESIKYLTPNEAELYIEEFCEDVIQLTAHEYGWCLLHRHFQALAHCADELGNPNPLETDSSKCNGCPCFSGSRKSHLAKQTQITISHLDFLEQNVWSMASLKSKSRKAVQDAQKLFPELKNLGEC
jgi:integrase